MSHPIKQEGQERFALYLYQCDYNGKSIRVWAQDSLLAQAFAAPILGIPDKPWEVIFISLLIMPSILMRGDAFLQN